MKATSQAHRDSVERAAISAENEMKTWQAWVDRGLVAADDARPRIEEAKERAQNLRSLLARLDGA